MRLKSGALPAVLQECLAFDNDVDEFLGHADDFDDLLACGGLLDFGTLQGGFLQRVFGEVCGDGELVADFAVDLDDDLDFIEHGRGWIVDGPMRFVDAAVADDLDRKSVV